ncbi:MAG TPA: DUF4159 domain-containing protein [Gammaproteobacteria bacterium]
MTHAAARAIAAAVLALGVLTPSLAQRDLDAPERPGEFHFARMIYKDLPRYRRFGGGWWMQDWPDSEEHFTQGVSRLSRIDAGSPVSVGLTDDNLFDYPWLYVTQAGYWDLSDEEIALLREYLDRGGFLIADDFFGPAEWSVFREAMTRLFPDRPMVEIAGDDEVLHVLYDIDKFTQIPGLRHLRRFGGSVSVQRLPPPEWHGIYDDDGRLMVAANYNQDVGDAWEHADDAYYPEPMTALAYRFGLNYIIYAMTH